MKQLLSILATALAASQLLGAQATVAPTVDQILSLKRVASPAVSPDGRLVAYTLRDTTYIKQAKTPTLIQHGATDQHVPLPNAFELYQGLLDNSVPAKLIVYEGFGGIGHGPSKPKSHRATMEHNIEWFDQYLFQTAAKPSTEQR